MHPTDYNEFDYKDLPKDGWVATVVASRRSGKSFLSNNLIQRHQKDPQHRFSHIFLISGSKSYHGFDGVPPSFRFDRLEEIEYRLAQQERIIEHNGLQTDNAKRYRSRILVIVDDCSTNRKHCEGLEHPLLRTIAQNGRHYSLRDTYEPEEGELPNSVNTIIISQCYKQIPKPIRLNTDVFFCSHISSLVERRDLLDENFHACDGSTEGKKYGQQTYEMLTTHEPYAFVCVELYRQQKRTLTDYIRRYKAEPMKAFRFFGTARDWQKM